MTRADLDLVAELVRARSGLVLTPDKGYLVESRLTPLVRKEGFDTLDAMFAALRTKRDDRLAWLITEAMTTNETLFFRDKTPFTRFLEDMLPALTRARRPGAPLRIWSAACSSGQEAYSLAMLLDENAKKLGGLQPEIIGTDISTKVLEKAKAGVFSQFEVQRGLPVKMLVKYFEKIDDMWRIKPAIRSAVQFKRLNLLETYSNMPKFDIVFCRNVLIYFDQQQKADVLNKIARQCMDDGFLVLGSAETVMGMTDAFAAVPGKRGLYQRATPAARAADVA